MQFETLNVFLTISRGMGIIKLAKMTGMCKNLKKSVIFGNFCQFLHIFEPKLPILLMILNEMTFFLCNLGYRIDFGHFKQARDLKLDKMTEFLKFLRLCHHRKYRTFPTSTTPRGKTRFFEVHMMSHFRKILLEPSSI